jgi:hypothetical protein
MPQVVSSIVSDKWRQTVAQFYAHEVTHGADNPLAPVAITQNAPDPAVADVSVLSWPKYFKIGEGGWQDVAGIKLPLDPATALALVAGGNDITAGTAPYTSPSEYFFQKNLFNADLLFTAPSRLEIRCTVATGEANDDGHGNPPEFFELGIFDYQNRLLVYSTFPIEYKTNSRTLLHVIYVDF